MAALSLLLIPGRGWVGHRLDSFEEVPKASRVRVEFSSWLDISPGLVMSWAL